MKVEAVAQQVEDTVLADHVGGGIDEEWETEVEPAGQRHPNTQKHSAHIPS